MAIPTRLLTATCNIDNGTLTAQNRPPVFTGESGAMEVSVTFKKGGESYTIPSGVVASLYLYYPNTELMTIASEMAIDGATATGTLTEAQLGKEGYPMLMIQLADPETESMIVAASFPIKVTKSRGSYVVDIRPPSPSEIVYVGRSPYINTQNDHWMQWDSGNQQYEDTGVKAIGYSPYINSTNNHWMVWDESQGEYVDTQISATGVDPIDDTAGTGVTTKTWSANKLVSQFGSKANTTDIPGDMTGASASTAGTHGLVPAPSAGDQGKAFYGDGSWKDTYTKAQVDALLTSVFHYKGSKATYADIEAVTGQAVGDVWSCNADNSEYAWTGTAWEKLGPTIDLSAYLTSLSVAGITIDSTHTTITASQLLSAIGAVPTSRTINGHALTDNVTVTQSDVGLGNVDNTSDANKPISTATQTALNAKANTTDIPGVMTGASASSAGTSGLTPAPSAGDQDKALFGDGTWKSPPEGTVKSVNSISPNSNGNVLLKGSDIQLKAMSLQTVTQAIESVDGKTGSDIDTSDTDNTPIATTLSSLSDQKANEGTLAKVENGNTASETIPADSFYYHGGELFYTASQIAQGAAVPPSGSIPQKGLNAIYDKIKWTLAASLSIGQTASIPTTANDVVLVSRDIYGYYRGTINIPRSCVINNNIMILPLEGGKRVLFDTTSTTIKFTSTDYGGTLTIVEVYYR